MLGGQGQLGLQHQGGGEAGEAGGQEVLVQSQVRRVDRGRGRCCQGTLRATTPRLLLLDEGAHVEGPGGGLEVVRGQGLGLGLLLFCLDVISVSPLLLLLVGGLTPAIRLSISVCCNN